MQSVRLQQETQLLRMGNRLFCPILCADAELESSVSCAAAAPRHNWSGISAKHLWFIASRGVWTYTCVWAAEAEGNFYNYAPLENEILSVNLGMLSNSVKNCSEEAQMCAGAFWAIPI